MCFGCFTHNQQFSLLGASFGKGRHASLIQSWPGISYNFVHSLRWGEVGAVQYCRAPTNVNYTEVTERTSCYLPVTGVQDCMYILYWPFPLFWSNRVKFSEWVKGPKRKFWASLHFNILLSLLWSEGKNGIGPNGHCLTKACGTDGLILTFRDSSKKILTPQKFYFLI